MAFTLSDLASELGIDVSTLKPESVNKWNGYLSEADTKYQQATTAQREAQEKVEQAKRDQAAIDEQIKSFGVTEARLTELTAANAAYKAALENAKTAGLNIDLSGIPTPAAATPPDPTKTMRDEYVRNFSNMGAVMKVQSRYQAVFGKPYTDDPVRLIDEATAARMPVEQYAESKYKFAEEQARIEKEARQKEIQAGIDAGVKKWQEEHPVTAGHPDLARGRDSNFSKIYKPRTAQESADFRKMSPKDRIAASVSRVRQAIAANAE